jgi:hypothetical protein
MQKRKIKAKTRDGVLGLRLRLCRRARPSALLCLLMVFSQLRRPFFPLARPKRVKPATQKTWLVSSDRARLTLLGLVYLPITDYYLVC